MAAFLIPMLAGAAGGALLKKDDPLKGALMGAGLGAGGAALAPGLLGGGAAAGAGSQAGMLAAQEAGLGASSLGWGGATTGMQGAMNGAMGSSAGATAGGLLGQADKFAKPASTAMQAYGMFNQPEQPVQASPMAPNSGTGPGALSQLAGQGQQNQQMTMQQDAERKMRRDEMLARMRGGY